MKTACVVILFALLCLAGCERPQEVSLPDGRKVAVPHNATDVNLSWEENITPGLNQREGSANAKGPGLTTSADSIASEFNSSIGAIWTPGGFGIGGGTTSIKQSAQSAAQPWKNPLFWIGLGLITAGMVGWRYGLGNLAKYAVIMGTAALATAFYPGLIILFLLAAAAAAFWPQIVAEWQRIKAQKAAHRYREGLRAVVAGVEQTSDAARLEVKKNVQANSDPPDRDTIREIKRGDDYGPER